jgi:uncharacterized RDD family membrane protein YckC
MDRGRTSPQACGAACELALVQRDAEFTLPPQLVSKACVQARHSPPVGPVRQSSCFGMKLSVQCQRLEGKWVSPVSGCGWGFLLDTLILVALLLAWNLLAGYWLVHLGLWAHFADLAIIWLYFGPLSSRMAGGQSLGKRMGGIQVVASGGKPVSVGRGLARAAPLAIAVGGGLEPVSMFSGSPLVILIGSVVAGAISLGLGYFYVFNTRTRQSLHDLLAGTYVVQKGQAPLLSAGPGVLRLAVVYVLILVAGAAVASRNWPQMRERTAEYNRLAAALSRIDGFLHLKTLKFDRDAVVVDVISKPGQMTGPVDRDIARAVIAQYPGLEPAKELEIRVGYGFGKMVKWMKSSSRKMPVERWKMELGLL